MGGTTIMQEFARKAHPEIHEAALGRGSISGGLRPGQQRKLRTPERKYASMFNRKWHSWRPEKVTHKKGGMDRCKVKWNKGVLRRLRGSGSRRLRSARGRRWVRSDPEQRACG